MEVCYNGVPYLVEEFGEEVSYYTTLSRVLIGRAVPCMMSTDIDLFRAGPEGESFWVRSIIMENTPIDVEAAHRVNLAALLSVEDTGL